MKRSKWLAELISHLLALLFLFTAASKLFSFQNFVWSINNQPFDNRWTPFLVVSLPLVELITTFLLLWPKTRLKGLLLSAILMFVFSVYITLVTFHFYDRVPCACAGVFAKLSWPQHLVFNIFFLALAIIGIRISIKHQVINNTTYPSR